MKSKSVKIIVISVVSIIIIVCVIFLIVNIVKNSGKKDLTHKSLVLKDYEKVKAIPLNEIEKEESSFITSENIDISERAKKLLEFFGQSIEGEKTVKKILNREKNQALTRVIIGDLELDINEDKNIVVYKDSSTKLPENVSFKLGFREAIDDMIKDLESKLDLKDYKIISCERNFEESWSVTLIKEYEGDIFNPYESIDIVVNMRDGRVLYYEENDMKPNVLDPYISKDEAIKIVKKNFESKIVTENPVVTLSLERPNFLFEEGGPYEKANFVRLCYKVEVDGGETVWVDAVTCEILGGSTYSILN